MTRIVIPDDSPPIITGTAALERIRSAAPTVVFNTPPASEDDLIRRIEGAHTVVNIRGYCKFPSRVLETVSGTLRHLAVWGTGTDNIDLTVARWLGIVVSNTPGTATDAIAEHTLGLLLAVAKRLVPLDASVRQGRWERGILFQCFGKTLGIIGTGAIGSRFAELGQSIGMRVIAWTLHPDAEKARRIGFAHVSTLDELLQEADVVSLHLRSSPATRRIIGPEQFVRMKTGAIFLNTARADLVDEDALLDALRSGKLLGAGLDVFTKEPVPTDEPLKSFPNVVLTPHTGANTPETLERGLTLCAENVVSYLTKGEVSYRVV
jgi:D-3-phosphoglycerate dehydrogenase